MFCVKDNIVHWRSKPPGLERLNPLSTGLARDL